ncbi:MAG: hypothetical protein JWP87_6169 [Labilithrix sp.]|nr:hypothetical protein [Labilithrix sp.]
MRDSRCTERPLRMPSRVRALRRQHWRTAPSATAQIWPSVSPDIRYTSTPESRSTHITSGTAACLPDASCTGASAPLTRSYDQMPYALA